MTTVEAEESTTIPLLPLPEITLRAAADVPPTRVLEDAKRTIPLEPFAIAAVPAALVPIRLLSTIVPVALPLTTIAVNVFPEMMFPALEDSPIFVLAAAETVTPPALCTAAVPEAFR